MHILVTGAAGFIGSFVCHRLLEMGYRVTGIDNLSDYYSVKLKQHRLALLQDKTGFTFYQLDLSDRMAMAELFSRERFKRVVHLGAQAGVRYSLDNPMAYADSNMIGTLTVLEGCRQNGVEHLVFASSSSVYGLNTKLPFSTEDCVDHPVSLYAATKKSNELMAHSYSHLYAIPTTGLRFFTVYGPWGRPDMAMYLFTRAIDEGKPLKVFNQGNMQRDFTYIDDIVEGVVRILEKVPQPDPAWRGSPVSASSAPYRIYNIGNNQPASLLDFIRLIEKALGKKALKEFLPMQAGDVRTTCADIEDLYRAVGFKPATPLEQGVEQYVRWYREYYG
ncbi:NAD-dependent epimerase [Lacimicrobium alkaliphilum]|uniref:NAD-dependent epimerase n=1 Tax=Lacimicrobium alkaliphilum TaxID=1526571 RepID=A0ABQ1R7E8_9ALTE|nr:NAD-dependent epimerase [Lacimicrobium alkaliphilum]GGD57376.1 NAD-dependent epimerase [Lacimicrobium alkaliphilum]